MQAANTSFSGSRGPTNKTHKTGSHYSYGEKRHKELNSCEKSITGRLDSVHMQLDLNETRVSSRHNLVNSITRLHKGLSYYFLGKDGNWLKSDDDLLLLSDVEAMLSISAQCSKFSQWE